MPVLTTTDDITHFAQKSAVPAAIGGALGYLIARTLPGALLGVALGVIGSSLIMKE
jgi:hypothetical protein